MLNADELVHCDSDHPFHKSLYKTLNLLRLFDREGTSVYFVVEGVADISKDDLNDSYFFDEHSCPTNYVPVEAIMTPTDNDPHGVFDYIVTRWMPKAYVKAMSCGDRDAFLRELFPEMSAAITA